MLARKEVIVQSTGLVDGTQGRRGQMEADHFIEDFRIDSLDKDVWFEGSLGVFHRKGKVISGSDVLSVVQAPAGSIGTKPALLVVVCCLLRIMGDDHSVRIGFAFDQRLF